MKVNVIVLLILVLSLHACNHRHNSEGHNHEKDEGSGQQENDEEPKFQYTAYSNKFEVFAEADPFVTGETANILAHFTMLPGFEPLEEGKITVIIQVDGSETMEVLESPTRQGIYSFNIQPGTAGNGSLRFVIEHENDTHGIEVPRIIVFNDSQAARDAAAEVQLPRTNTTVFTKEQSWKIDFATRLPEVVPFGHVIKTTALVKPSAGSETIIVARTGGIVTISSGNLLAGQDVAAGERLFTISGGTFAENNLSVRYAEVKNNYERAKADYERLKALAEDRIVSQRELLEAGNLYSNAEAAYNNLRNNFTPEGQIVSSPVSGFVRQVFFENGAYVEAGQPMVTVSQNKKLVVTADVAQRYASALSGIVSANIRNPVTGDIYTLEELNGKILSWGKAANTNNFLIPVNLEIDNKGNFVPGNFVEVYLKTKSGTPVTVVPSASLMEDQGNFFVWVQITPELFEKRLVVPGISDGINIQIENGLSPDERIVTRGAIMVKLAQATGTLDARSGHVH